MARDSADHDELYCTGRGAYTRGLDVNPVTNLLHCWCNSVACLIGGSLNRTDPRHFSRLRAAAGTVRPGAAGAKGSGHQEPGNSGEFMQLSSRRFLIAQDGVLYRLADATFIRMLQNPREHAFAVLAGQRVRMTSLIVELIDGKPARIARSDIDLRRRWPRESTGSLGSNGLLPNLHSIPRSFARSPRTRFSTRPLGSLRKEEDGVPRTRARPPSTRPHSDNFAVVGCSGPVA